MAKDVSIIEEAVIGYDAQKRFFVDAAKHFEVVPTEEILKNKSEYKKWFDPKGKIKTQILKNELFVIEGKSARGMWLYGDILTYMIQNESYRELGYNTPQEMFKDPAFPIGESTAYVAMSIYKRFDENTAILLKSKLTLLGSFFTEDLSEDQMNELIAKIIPMSHREAHKFIDLYKLALLKNKKLMPSDMEEREEKTITLSGKKTKQYIQIVFQKPKFKVQYGKKLELDWEDRERQQVGTLAIRELIEDGTLERRMNDIINREGFEKLRKKFTKKDEQ